MSTKKRFDFSTLCRHCDQETTEPIPATVTGTIPQYAEGDYLFNGAGITKYGDAEYVLSHDGTAMLQKLSITSAGCWYSSRFLESDTHARNKAANTITVSETGTPGKPLQPPSFLTRMRQLGDIGNTISDNTPANLMTLGGRLYALGDVPYIHEIDRETLHIKQRRGLFKELGCVTFVSHPVVDAEGNAYGLGQIVSMTGPKYIISKFPADGGAASEVGRLTTRWRWSTTYMHSLGITDKYLLVVEQPMAMSMKDAARQMIVNQPFSGTIKWYGDEDVLVNVLDLRTFAVIKQFVFDPMFAFHFANCYEDESGSIVMDFPGHPHPFLPGEMVTSILRKMSDTNIEEYCRRSQSPFRRVVLPMDVSSKSTSARVELTTLSAVGFENPCVNPLYGRRRHRFVYGSGLDVDGSNYGQITKLNVDTGETKTYSQEDHYPADVLFIPRPGAEAEDDGVLVSLCVVSSLPRLGCLLLLDAASLTQLATVTCTPAVAVPKPLHSVFFPL